MTFDEVVVNLLKDSTVVDMANRVYHLEVYQTNEKLLDFPCIIYSLRGNMPNTSEMSGQSGYRIAEFCVTIISKDSDVIRNNAQKLFDLNEEDPNETNYATYAQYGYDWLDVLDDQESVEYAIELEAKGYKTTTLQMLYYHRELTNNARSS